MTTDEIREKIVGILKKHGVKRAGLFGSYVRGEEKTNSDIDIVIEFEKGKSLLDLVNLEYKLEDKLNKNVDLLTYHSIHPLIKNRVLKEERKIL